MEMRQRKVPSLALRESNGSKTSAKKEKKRYSASYTEERLTIYNLIIDKLPRTLKREHIKQHFSKFGKIKEIELKYGKTRRTPTQCIIYFQDAEAAGGALQQRIHTVKHQRIKVSACPSWEQPFNINVAADSIPYILSLDDYCLEQIFQHLNLQHQIRLSLCHYRLEQVFVSMICARLERHLSFQQLQNFTAWEVRQFFRAASPFLESIEVVQEFPSNESINSICKFMKQYRPRITSVRVLGRCFAYSHLLEALDCSLITELDVYECIFDDFQMKEIRQLSNLRALGLGRNRYLRGTFLPRLRKLERLSLYRCGGIRQSTLLDSLKVMKLRYLDIRGAGELHFSNAMAEYGSEMETLRLPRVNSENVDVFKQLPKLKNLELWYVCISVAVRLCNLLVEHHGDRLEELHFVGRYVSAHMMSRLDFERLPRLRVLWMADLESSGAPRMLRKLIKLEQLEEMGVLLWYSGARPINNEMLLEMIKHCKQLKRIDIRRCRFITEDLVWDVLKVLRDRAANEGTTRQKPLKMLVHGTKIRSSILEHTAVSANRLLELSFTTKTPIKGLLRETSVFDLEKSTVDLQFKHHIDNNDDDDIEIYRYSSPPSDDDDMEFDDYYDYDYYRNGDSDDYPHHNDSYSDFDDSD